MDPNDSTGLAQGASAPVIDGATAAGISLPPGFAPRVRTLPAFVPPAEPVAPAPSAVPESAAEPVPAPMAADPAPAVASVVEAPSPAVQSSATPATPAAPAFAGARTRSRIVSLEWPLFYDGKLYDHITIARPTTRAVAEFYDRLAALPEADSGRGLRFPIFFDDAGEPVPEAVMDALDPDDADNLQGDITDFLPRQLRALRGSASTPPSGEGIDPTSSE